MLFKEPTKESPINFTRKGCVGINTGKKFRNISDILEKNTAWG